MADGGIFSGIHLEVDPDMPAHTIEMRSGENRLRTVLAGAAEEMLWQRYKDDPAFAEEITSLTESKDYITYPGEKSEPEKCEVCGTPVTIVPEEHIERRGKREPALWEADLWRRHTPRRCTAMRGLSGG